MVDGEETSFDLSDVGVGLWTEDWHNTEYVLEVIYVQYVFF